MDVDDFGPVADLSHGNRYPDMLKGASIVIWTTTPWTIPGNRAIAFSQDIDYGAVRSDPGSDGQLGAALATSSYLADALAESVQERVRA